MKSLKCAAWITSLVFVTTLAQAQNHTSTAETTDTDTVNNTNTQNAASVANPVAAAPLTEAEVAHILSTANKGEIDASKMASKKAEHKDVKSFASMMVKEHQKNDKESKALLKKTKIKPKDNDVSKVLKRNTKDQMDSLKKLKGSEFDKAYMASQIAMHEQVLNTLETKLIPAAQNPALKSHLEATKTHVETHLAKAKDLEISISK